MLYSGRELGTFKKKERQVGMPTVAKEDRWVGEVDNGHLRGDCKAR